MENFKDNFFSNILVSSISEFLNLVIKFFISILLARMLGPQGRGEYALALLIPWIFIMFFSFGIGEATTVLIGKKRFFIEKVVKSLNFYVITTSIICFLIYFFLSDFILKIVKYNIKIELYYLSFLVIPLTLFWGGFASVLLGLSEIKVVSWGRLLNNIAFIFLLIVFSFFLKITVQIVMIIFSLSLIIEIIYCMYFISKYTKIGICFEPEVLREQIKFGGKFFVSGLFNYANRRLDSLLINFFIGTYYLGIYTIAVGITENLLTLSNVLSRVIFSSSATSSNTNESSTTTDSIIRQNIFIMFLFGLILAVFVRPILVFLYSSKFVDSIIPTLFLIPGVISLGVGLVIGYALAGYEKPEEVTKSSAIACVFTVVLDFILIPKYKVNGAALTSTIAYTIGTVYLIVSYLKITKHSILDILILRKQDIKGYFEIFKKKF